MIEIKGEENKNNNNDDFNNQIFKTFLSLFLWSNVR